MRARAQRLGREGGGGSLVPVHSSPIVSPSTPLLPYSHIPNPPQSPILHCCCSRSFGGIIETKSLSYWYVCPSIRDECCAISTVRRLNHLVFLKLISADSSSSGITQMRARGSASVGLGGATDGHARAAAPRAAPPPAPLPAAASQGICKIEYPVL